MNLNNPIIIRAEGLKGQNHRGVPQGVSTSALFGMMVLESMNVYNLDQSTYLGYADDGLIASDLNPDLQQRLHEAIQSPLSGVSIKQRKSRYVKRNGIWLSPLKFLGCELNGESGIFRAKTRSKIEHLMFEGGGLSHQLYNSRPPIMRSGLSYQEALEKGYLNYLLAQVFSTQATESPIRSIIKYKNSLLDVMDRNQKNLAMSLKQSKGLIPYMSLATASSFAFEYVLKEKVFSK